VPVPAQCPAAVGDHEEMTPLSVIRGSSSAPGYRALFMDSPITLRPCKIIAPAVQGYTRVVAFGRRDNMEIEAPNPISP
jgi:hypothetical protein